VKAVRRAVFAVVTCALVAAIPVSASASQDLLQAAVQNAQSQFTHAVGLDIAAGLESDQAETLMWRYSSIQSQPAGAWWQVVAVEHQQLDALTTLEQDLDTAYSQSLAKQRDGFLRAIHQWDSLHAEAIGAGVETSDLDATHAQFVGYASAAETPNDYASLAQVLTSQTSLLNDRLAGFRAARDAAQLALQNARSLLANASQYPQLNLSGFAAQIQAAAASMGNARLATDYQAIQGQLQQTAVAVQGLLNARSAAYSQLSSTQATLQNAQSVGAFVGNAPSAIASLGAQIGSAGDTGTFRSITAQLSSQQQTLNDAIFAKENQLTSPNMAGKVIVVSLSRQVLTAYQDGNALLTTYVTTGRPALPTPPGVYHVFARYSPYEMISPWPYGSPYWYPPSWVNWAMEFRGGGYFIHDAPWRSWYGPGSDIYDGTHGCVNVPYSPMLTLWRWTPIGTTVIVEW
jgi:lipoprotein-anchoring transpeptidase ErfK/SrfK